MTLTYGTILSETRKRARRAQRKLYSYIPVGSPPRGACSSASLRRAVRHNTAAEDDPPANAIVTKCGRLHNTTTSNSGRFDGARYRPLATDIQGKGRRVRDTGMGGKEGDRGMKHRSSTVGQRGPRDFCVIYTTRQLMANDVRLSSNVTGASNY